MARDHDTFAWNRSMKKHQELDSHRALVPFLERQVRISMEKGAQHPSRLCSRLQEPPQPEYSSQVIMGLAIKYFVCLVQCIAHC